MFAAVHGSSKVMVTGVENIIFPNGDQNLIRERGELIPTMSPVEAMTGAKKVHESEPSSREKIVPDVISTERLPQECREIA